MRLFSWLVLLASAFIISGCRKEKPINIQGQLLLTSKNPIPLSNRRIQIYQQGNSSAIGLSSGSTSSSSTGETDGNGFFTISFKPGKSSFLFLSGQNGNRLEFSNSSNDTSFPSFSRKEFPLEENDATKPIIIGKTIDTVILKVHLFANLRATDTLGLKAATIAGNLNKEYPGLSGLAGDVIILDTIYNMLFTHFDCYNNQFYNSIHSGVIVNTGYGNRYISNKVIQPSVLSPSDETKMEMLYAFP